MSKRSTNNWIGRPLPRFEDARFVTGRGRYVGDMRPPDCLYAMFVRSPHARARIAGIDAAAARKIRGVAAVVTAPDLAGVGAPSVNKLMPLLRVPPFAILAADAVNAVGEPVAAVIAASLEAARDAVERIEVTYEPLDPVLDRGDGAETLFVDLPGNEAAAERWQAGDCEAAFASAEKKVRAAVSYARLSAVPMEPRAVLAEWTVATEQLTVWSSTQVPHRLRAELARILGLDPARVHAVAPDVGGAFGAKTSIHSEDIVVAWAAMRLRRPVQWCATRSEDLMAATHARGIRSEGELALDRDGIATALRARIAAPLGHWLPYSAVVPPRNAARILPGPYAIRTVDIAAQAHVCNTAAVAIYRGAGRPEAAMLIERLMDEAARAIGMDPLELRRRNVVRQFPYATATGNKLDSGDYDAALARAAELADYEALKAERAARRARGERFGVGVALYVEPCGQGWESARIRLERDGSFMAATGTSAQGQGRETCFAQIAADALGVAPQAVTVRHGDTRAIATGIGAIGSRSTAIGGSAMLRAAESLRERGRALAAQLLQATPETVAPSPGGFALAADPSRHVTWAGLAEAAQEQGATLGADHVFTAEESWSFGCCIAAAAIDRETGRIAVERVAWVDDAGVIVNPLLAQGQLWGGLAQGIGETLMERIVYDGDGQLLTGSLMDYAVPRAGDMPAQVALDKSVTPSPANALGAKGLGEAGCIAVPAALVNAIADAAAPGSFSELELPLTAEALWRKFNME